MNPMTISIAAMLATAVTCFGVVAWKDYERWKNPNGNSSEFGDVDPQQLSRIEHNQRQRASMDRGARRA